MSDNFNEASDAEAKRRAERIAAIRRSVRAASDTPVEQAAETVDKAAGAADILSSEPLPAESGTSDWENELAERIAGRIQKVKQNRASSAENILRELGLETSPAKSGPVQNEAPTEAEAYVPKHEAGSYVPKHEAGAYVPKHEAAPYVPKHEAPPVQEEPAVSGYPSHAAEDGPSAAESGYVPKHEAARTAADGYEDFPDSYGAQKPLKKKKKKKKKKRSFKERFRGLFPQRGDSVFECIRKGVFLVAIAVIIVCGYIVADYYIDLWRSKRENRKVMNNYWHDMEETTEPSSEEEPDNRKVYTLLKGAQYLLGENDDVVGVIKIEGTPVDNPVMQADDNSKYLNHKLSGRESRPGELFLDYRNHFDEVDDEGHLICENSDNLVIYGHNMKDEQMFGSLKSYQRNDSYYGEHPVILLNSNYEQYQYKIFAFFILDVEDDTDTAFRCWEKFDFDDEDDFYSFVNEAKRRTLRLNDVDVKYGDNLLTLYTCNTILGERGRLILLARQVRDGEDPLAGTQNSTANPNIKWPSIYYTYKGTGVTYDPEAEFVPYGPDKNSQVK